MKAEELKPEKWVRDKINRGVATYNYINAIPRDKWFELMEDYAKEYHKLKTQEQPDKRDRKIYPRE